MKIINPFKSHKKKDFVAYWDLKQFSQLLNKGIEVGSNYFFLIKNVGVFLFVRESDFKGTRVFESEDIKDLKSRMNSLESKLNN